ncbi:cytochrome P450 [Cercophora newfieldiana]|uniref:Cytochrome P450 n=1 Tax=Cercophora newfieldiana TaxID=92897 RepID=A0AA39XX88_9PEZI|nr:cytochrome P450 [Cercophora newfieldiana]
MPSLQYDLANAFQDVFSDFQEVKPRTLVLVGGPVLLVLITVYRYFAAWYRLRHVPGPFVQSWTSLVQVKKMWEGHAHLYYNGLAEKYGEPTKYVCLFTDAAMPTMMSIMVIPGLYKWFQRWPLSTLMPSSKDKSGFGCMIGFAEKFVDERLRPDAKPQRDIIQSFIKHGLDRDQLVQEILIQILAGSDTTATAIRMTLLFLITSPPALRALLREIDDGVESGRVSSPVTNAEAFAMPYLQAVIHEGLRLYSPGVGPLYKQVPKGGDTIHGYFLPEGTQVGQNMWGIQRRKDVFGEDADVFRPERWLEAEEGRLKAMKETVDLVFGYGKYQCLGKQMAYMEINKLLVELLRRYDFSLVDPVNPMHLRSATLWMTKNFWLKITRRE